MLQNNEKRNASIPIPNYTQQPIKNTNVTPQFSQTEQSSLNILPSIPNTPSLSKVPSEESFNNYIYHEHSYEEHDDSPKSIFTNNPTGENEFEEIIQNNDPINVSKDNENRKETPEEQKKRLYEEDITNKFNDIVNKAGNNSKKNLITKEELKIYKKYRKIRKPNINYEIKKVPTYGSVKKYDETYPQQKT